MEFDPLRSDEHRGDDKGPTEAAPDANTDSSSDKTAGPSLLDLAFAMDCTGSMGSYIHNARQVGISIGQAILL